MIKSVNQLITMRCNSRCTMCKIWEEDDFSNEMKTEDYRKLYALPIFAQLADVAISGGEPALTPDMLDITNAIIDDKPCLNTLFYCTNGINPRKAVEFVEEFAPKVKNVFVSVSIDGPRSVHKNIRGIDCYDSAIKTLNAVRDCSAKNVKTLISTTIVSENCNVEALDHIRDLAQSTQSTHTFRLAAQSDTFYANAGVSDSALKLSSDKREFIAGYIQKHYSDDSFMMIQHDFIANNKSFLGTKDNLRCLAGNISVFVKPDGSIYPCINSTRIIGNRNGLFQTPYTLGSMEKCPCCTECQIYPMLNYAQFKS